MQAYHVIIVQNQEIKEKIQAVSWNQPQVGTCSDLIVFCAKTDLLKAKNEYFDLISDGDATKRNALGTFEQMVEGFITRKGNDAIFWSEKQTYIAMGFAMAACAELHIDSCPMEGFDSEQVKTILSLPDDYSVTLMLPIGYRPEEAEIRPKTRFSESALFSFV
jgi:nitroreductase